MYLQVVESRLSPDTSTDEVERLFRLVQRVTVQEDLDKEGPHDFREPSPLLGQ